MTSKPDTKNQILKRADKLLLERGFNGFSYKDISTPMGIKNAAIHYHFATKEDLGVALFDRYRDVLRERTTDFMMPARAIRSSATTRPSARSSRGARSTRS